MVVLSAQSHEGEEELALLRYFSTPPLRDDPSNHVVPCLDCFPIPNTDSGHFIVMPLLGRYDDNPPFHNLAEVHDCLQQIFEVNVMSAIYVGGDTNSGYIRVSYLCTSTTLHIGT